MAGRFSVEAVFKAVDRVTAPVSRMQNRVGKFTRGLSRGLRRANRQLDRMVGGLARGAARLAKFGGAVIGAAGAATALALERTADAADKLAKTSRRLQFPIEELQEWRFVAEQSGVDTSVFEQSMGAFSKRLGEARAGTGALTTMLKKSNPELLRQITAADNVAQAFDLYIGAIREAETAQDQAALASAGFSRAGLELINISHNSADAINALRKEQRENGNITMAQAQAAEAYNDSVNSLKRSLTGLMQSVLLPMLPTITETVREWREWIVANKDMLRTRIVEFALNLKRRIMDLVDAVIEFNKRYNLGERLGEGLDMLGQFARFLSENGMLILKLVGGVVALSLTLKALAAVMAVVNIVMAANPIGLIVLAIGALIAAVAAAIIWWDEIKAAFMGASAEMDVMIGVISALMGPIGWLVGGAALILKHWEPIKEFFSDLWDSVTASFDAAIAAIERKVSALTGWVGDVKDSITGFGDDVAGFFGFGDDEEQGAAAGGPGAGVISPQERVARSVEESRTTESSEVTIRDETGRAEVTRGRLGGIKLQPTGGF